MYAVIAWAEPGSLRALISEHRAELVVTQTLALWKWRGRVYRVPLGRC